MILVTGGTGIVGSHLLYFLLKEEKQVRAIRRENSDVLSIKRIFGLYTHDVDTLYNKIEWVEADITDIPALSFAFKGVKQVYHCAALIDFDASNYKLLKKVNVEGTANIVNICLAKKINKLCYVSSVATFGNVLKDQKINEETSWNPDGKNGVYAITKYGAEMEVWRGTQEGLNAVIVNPGVILGTSPHSNFSGEILHIASLGIPFYPTGAVGFVDVKDVVRAMVLLMESAIKNEQFILVGQNLSFKELMSKIALIKEKKPPLRKVSESLMLLISALDLLSNKIFGTKRRLPKSMVRSMYQKSLYDASKITDLLNFRFTPIEETLRRMVKEEQKIKG